MARNGSGVYALPSGTTVASGDTVDPTWANTLTADLESDANTARPVVAGGTGAATAADARTNLGVQALDALLTAIAALTTSADRFLKFTGTDTVAVFDLFGTANTFTATQTGPAWALTGGASGVSISGGVVYFSGDANDALSFNQSGNSWTWAIGGTGYFSLTSTVAEFDAVDTRIEPTPASLATNSAGFRGTIINTQDADYTLVIGDSGKTIRHTSGSAHAWTIPPVSSVASPIGTMVRFRNVGAGAVTITRGSGVVLRVAGASTDQNVTLAQWGDAVATMEASDTWVISGTGIS